MHMDVDYCCFGCICWEGTKKTLQNQSTSKGEMLNKLWCIHSAGLRDNEWSFFFLFLLIWRDGQDALGENRTQKKTHSMIFKKTSHLPFPSAPVDGHVCCSASGEMWDDCTCCQHCLPVSGVRRGDLSGEKTFKSLLNLFLFISELFAFFQTHVSFIYLFIFFLEWTKVIKRPLYKSPPRMEWVKERNLITSPFHSFEMANVFSVQILYQYANTSDGSW